MYYWLWNTLKFNMRDTAYIYYGIHTDTHKLYTYIYLYITLTISKLELVLRLLPAKSLIVFHEHQTQIISSREDSWGGGGGVGGCREGS